MTRRFSEPHRVSEPIQYDPIRVQTDDGITHAAYPPWRPLVSINTRTYCNQSVWFDKGSSEENSRLFCSRIEDDAIVDCMTCIVKTGVS